MVVAPDIVDWLLYQTNLLNIRVWSTKGGITDALDDFCDSLGLVAAWCCQQLHGRRFHPHPARVSACGSTN